MKLKLIAMILTISLCFALAACGSGTTGASTTAVTVTSEPVAETTEAPEAAATEEPAATEETEEVLSVEEVFNLEDAENAYTPDTLVFNAGSVEILWKDYYGAIAQVLYELNSYYGITDLNEEVQEGMTIADWVRGWSEEYLRQLALLHEKAEELGIELTEEDQALIEADIDEQANTYFDGDREALFAEMHVTEELYRYQAEASMLYDKLFTYYFGEDGQDLSDEDAVAYVEDAGYLYAKHILWSFTDENGADLSDEEKEAARAQAQEVLDELRAEDPANLGSAFDRMMEHYSADPGLAAYPDGYYFQPGDMVAVFEDAATELAEGELSELVESDYGIHLLYRPAMDADHIFGYDSYSNAYTLRYLAANELFTNMADEWMDQQTVEYAGDFENLDLIGLMSFTA